MVDRGRQGYPGGRDNYQGRSVNRGYDNDRQEGGYGGGGRGGGRGGPPRGDRGGGGGGFGGAPTVYEGARGGDQVQLLSNHFKFGLRNVQAMVYVYKVEFGPEVIEGY